MKTLAFIVVMVLMLLFLFEFARRKKGSGLDKGYEQKPVMTEVERKLYYLLDAAISSEYLVFAQVQLTGFMRPVKGEGAMGRLNKIHRKSVDFLICDKEGKPLAAIELQDSTHEHERRKVADSVKAKALESSGVPLIEFFAKKLPTVEETRMRVDQVLQLHG